MSSDHIAVDIGKDNDDLNVPHKDKRKLSIIHMIPKIERPHFKTHHKSVSTGNEDFIIKKPDDDDKPHNGNPCTIMEISPNCKYLVTYSEKDNSFVVWDVKS